MKEITTNSEQHTKNFGMELAGQLMRGSVLLLRGRPGVGKTALVRGISQGLGYHGVVNSPTFTLINEYQGNMPIYHMDLYRLGENASEQSLYDLGLDEYLFSDGICLIEWPEALGELGNAVVVDIEYISENERKISVCNMQGAK